MSIRTIARFLAVTFLAAIAGCGNGTAQDHQGKIRADRQLSPVLSAEDLFKRVSPSVFVIESLDPSGRPVEQGSAVVIGKALIETNYHVIKDGAAFLVMQGMKKWRAVLVATNPDHDIAQLRVDGLRAPAVALREFSALAVGEHVYAIGSPEGLELTLSEGLISSLRQSGSDRVIQTTAPISPGSSGGGLFDTEARLVGITVAYLKQGQNLNFALPTGWISTAHSPKEWDAICSSATSSADKQLRALPSRAERDSESRAYEVAADDCRQAVRLDPHQQSSWNNLGHVLAKRAILFEAAKEQQRDREQALSAYKEALQLNSSDETAWKGLASAYAPDQRGEAVLAYKRALALDPRDVDAWEHLGLTYPPEETENGLAALDTARALIGQDDSKAWGSLGLLYEALGYVNHMDLLDCLKLLGPRCPMDDRDAQALINRAWNSALNCEQRAVRINPTDAVAWQDLGAVYADLNDRAGVMKVYEKLKAIDPKRASTFLQRYVLPK